MSAPVVLEAPVPLPVAPRLRARVAVAAARTLLRAAQGRPAHIGWVLRLASRHVPPASCEQARAARAAVTTVSLHAASDHGCLLRSVATVIACRLQGRGLVWRVGVVSPPPASHSWVEAEGAAVGEPFDPYLLYTPII